MNQKDFNNVNLEKFLNHIIMNKSEYNIKKNNLEKHNSQNSWNNINQKLRLGGLVEEDSIISKGKLVKFRITDGNKSVLVQYNGILPDLFKEKQGVIVEGEFDSLIFNASNLLAKHDENYIPKEVANSLKQQGLWKGKTEIE